MQEQWMVAIIIGVLQGIFEWLPISSEGNITIALTALGSDPSQAVAYALFLHVGTALSATMYYRGEVWRILSELPHWRPRDAFTSTPTLSFLGLATITSGLVGVAAYLALEQVVSILTGGAFILLIGILLVVTGIVQRSATGIALGTRTSPSFVDAIIVGGLQGLAILPGVSRSGVTTSALLFRGYDGPESFRLSFLLSIPAALGGGLIAVIDDGLVGVAPESALLALIIAAVVGYLTIDLLMRVVRQVAFWVVCVGLGGLAIFGSIVLLV